MNKKNTKPTIGLIEGGGTGLELTKAFKDVTSEIYKKETGENLYFLSFNEEFGYTLRTYHDFEDDYRTKDYSYIRKMCLEEVDDILKYNKIFLNKDGVGIFRTAINAETLYYLRKKTKSIKFKPLRVSNDRDFNILFIRDQIQGYYTTEKIEAKNKTIKIESLFNQENFELILDFVKEKINEKQIKNPLILFLYKFHIMGVELERMIEDAFNKSGIDASIKILQPDSGTHFILKEIHKKNIDDVVTICSNESGDMLLEFLMHYYNLGLKETSFTSNFVLNVNGIEALQTVHGSADDIANQNIVNPIATIKAAAHGLEEWLGVNSAKERIEEILKQAKNNNMVTRDMGGNLNTDEVVQYVINNWN